MESILVHLLAGSRIKKHVKKLNKKVGRKKQQQMYQRGTEELTLCIDESDAADDVVVNAADEIYPVASVVTRTTRDKSFRIVRLFFKVSFNVAGCAKHVRKKDDTK